MLLHVWLWSCSAPLWSGQSSPAGFRLRCFLQACQQGSLQRAVTLDALLLVRAVERLDRLLVDQRPEVLEGDVLVAGDAHLLQELTHTVLALQRLGEQRHLFGDEGLELGGVHGGSVICSLVKLRHHGVDGQLQL